MRCIVTEAKNNYAVLLNESGEFFKVKNKDYCVGQKITYKKNVTMLVSIAASFLIFIITVMSGYGLYYNPDNYVSIDINPSIQLTTNRFSKVISMQSFNDEGKIILERGVIKNKSIENAIENIVVLSLEMGYLSKDNSQVLIEIVKKDDNTMQVINQKLDEIRSDSILINVEQSNEEILELSRELGISVGRTKAIYEYTNTYGGDLKENKEQLKDQSIALIKKGVKSTAKEVQIEKIEDVQDRIDKSKTNINVTNDDNKNIDSVRKKENGNQNSGKIRSNENKPNDKKPDDVRSNDNKPVEVRPNEVKPDATRPNENKPDITRPVEVISEDDKPVEVRPNKNKPVDVRPRPNENKPVEVKPDSTRPNMSIDSSVNSENGKGKGR